MKLEGKMVESRKLETWWRRVWERYRSMVAAHKQHVVVAEKGRSLLVQSLLLLWLSCSHCWEDKSAGPRSCLQAVRTMIEPGEPQGSWHQCPEERCQLECLGILPLDGLPTLIQGNNRISERIHYWWYSRS